MCDYSYAMADNRYTAFQFTADAGLSASNKFEVIYFNRLIDFSGAIGFYFHGNFFLKRYKIVSSQSDHTGRHTP